MTDEFPNGTEDGIASDNLPSIYLLPHLALSSRIEGPCFTFEVDALREDGELRIIEMRAIGRSLEGVARVAYTFHSKIDLAGVGKISPILVQLSATHDLQFLLKVFQVTEAHSTGDWQATALPPPGDAEKGILYSTVPSFEEFCRDPGILSRAFWCPRNPAGECNQKLEAELAGWGEFLEVRVLSRAVDLTTHFTAEAYLKILLPWQPTRTYEKAYSEAKQLLEAIAQSYQSDGITGITRFLEQSEYQTLYGGSFAPGHEAASSDTMTIKGVFVPVNSELDIAAVGNQLRYSITPEQGRIQLNPLSNQANTTINICITPKAPFRALSAHHIRCTLSLISCIRAQRWQPSNYWDWCALNLLSEKPGPQESARGLPPGTPSGDAEGALDIFISTFPSHIKEFLTPQGYGVIQNMPDCIVQCEASAQIDLTRVALQGALWLSLTLSPALTARQPELFSRCTLTIFPDGALGVQMTNEIGGSAKVVFPLSPSKGDQMRREICDQVCRTFVEQTQQGWLAVLSVMQELCPSLEEQPQGLLATKNLPAIHDVSAHACFAIATKLAALLLRGGEDGLCCTLSCNSAHCWQLRAQSINLAGAVEIDIEEAQVEQIRFQYLPTPSAEASQSWTDIGALKRHNSKRDDGEHHEIISGIRGYFRERHALDARASPHPDTYVFQKVASHLERIGFIASATTKRPGSCQL